jgi:hypothetical protein
MNSQILPLIVFIVFTTMSYATTYNFIGTSDVNWSTPTNWNPSGVPASGDTLIFTTGKSSICDVSTPDLLISVQDSSMITVSSSVSWSALSTLGDYSPSVFCAVSLSVNAIRVSASGITTFNNCPLVILGPAASSISGQIQMSGTTVMAFNGGTTNITASISCSTSTCGYQNTLTMNSGAIYVGGFMPLTIRVWTTVFAAAKLYLSYSPIFSNLMIRGSDITTTTSVNPTFDTLGIYSGIWTNSGANITILTYCQIQSTFN